MIKLFTKKEDRIPFTKEGYGKLLEERSALLSERPEAVEHLRKSREMGDLSENGYYKASRARLSFLDSRIRRVERLIRLAKVVESSGSNGIEIGSQVTLTDGTRELHFTIVGGYESNPLNHTISYVSPLGKALIGKKVNEIAEVHAPSGIMQYIIKAIS